jgi:hypothetical protein
VRDWGEDCYADRGRPSIDPVVFFKLQLILFVEGLRSERRLIETASLHLAHRWYLGYGLDEPPPDHSVCWLVQPARWSPATLLADLTRRARPLAKGLFSTS